MQNPALLSLLCRFTDAPGLSCIRLQGGPPNLGYVAGDENAGEFCLADRRGRGSMVDSTQKIN